jgi:hypothetical protein
MAPKWYEALFTGYAETYDKESFTQGTLGECDFIESEIGGDRSVPILDIGFAAVEIFGAKLGAFSRGDALTPEDFEMLAVAVKP